MTPKENNMLLEDILQRKLDFTELELRAILDITQAINNNASADSLYKIYHFTLIGTLNVLKLALYVLDENEWECKVCFGTTHKFELIPLELEKINTFRTNTPLNTIQFTNPAFKEFDLLIPIYHKDKSLCFIFLNTYLNIKETEPIDVRFVQTLTNIITVAIENKKLVRKQIKQEALNKEMEIAKQVQTRLFPKTLPHTDTIQIKATYIPHDLIGGDYYDHIQLNEDQFMLCIADISGKGIPAALVMSNVQASLRVLIKQNYTLKQIVERLNFFVSEITQKDNFVTFFIAIYDTKLHTLEYINAGHNPAVLYDIKHGQIHNLEQGCTVLGMFDPLPFINQTTINNLTNFLLFCYTDGLTEAMTPEEEIFGVERVIHFMQSHKYTNLEDLNKNLIKEVKKFMRNNEFNDDITILSLRVTQLSGQ